MKFTTTLFTLLFFCALPFLQAQVPQAFNYQAVARDANGDCLSDQTIDVRIGIRDSSASGTVVYLERFDNVMTNQQGLFSLSIGTGVPQGTPGFNSLDWSIGQRWLEVEIDTGSGFVLVGSQQLMSVPYAMISNESLSLQSVIPSTLSISSGGTTLVATLEETWSWENNGHAYVLYSVPSQINWLTANDFCREASGHLITITNTDENQFVFSNVLSHPLAQERIPLGLTDAIQENAFHWVTGEIGLGVTAGTRNVYRNWAPSQPDNSNGAEHVGEIRDASNYPARTWNDITASPEYYDVFLVEFSQGIISP